MTQEQTPTRGLALPLTSCVTLRTSLTLWAGAGTPRHTKLQPLRRATCISAFVFIKFLKRLAQIL